VIEQNLYFAAQQLCGAVTWVEFKEAFRAHHVPDGILHMKYGDAKMATCYDLTFNRAISVAIAVEEKGQAWKGSSAKGKDNRKTGRVFYTQVDVTPEGNPVLMGIFLVAHHFAKVLFDTGASHTFISRTFAVNYDLGIKKRKRVARPLNEVTIKNKYPLIWLCHLDLLIKEEHATHLRVCEFWLDQVPFLGHILSAEGVAFSWYGWILSSSQTDVGITHIKEHMVNYLRHTRVVILFGLEI
ncbi:hypothetical protein ACJX0J_020401, partial [Zea mays]